MSAISLKSITGITSITTPAGVDNQLTLHNNNTTEAVKLDVAGNVHINNHLAVTGVTTTTDNINIDADNKKLQIGDSQDLELFHNGTNSVINNTEGALLFQNNGSSSMYIGSDGQVYLNNDITFVGASANALWDKSENYFSIPDKIVHSGDTNTAIRFPGNDQISFQTAGLDRLRIEPDGVVIIGHNASRSVGYEHLVQLESTNSTPHSFSMVANRSSQFGANFDMAKSRSSSVGGSTIVQDDDILSQIVSRGADGTDVATVSTIIRTSVDGTPASDDIPGRIEFHTSTGGTAYERLRIDSAGNLSLGKGSAASTSYGRNLQIHHDGTSGASLHLTDNNTGSGNGDGFHIISTSQIAYLWQRENANMVFGTNGAARWNIYGSNGHLAPNADSTFDIGTSSVRVRNGYFDTLYGDGSNLTGISGVTINNNANDRIITGSGTANTLEGESNVTFDGTQFRVNAGNTSSIQVDGYYSYVQAAGVKLWRGAGNRSHNMGCGANTLANASGGQDCTALGHAALQNSTSGSANTALGSHSMIGTVTGNNNVAVGHGALNKNTSGYNNTAVGRLSGLENLGGHNNTFLGMDAGTNNTSGNNNIYGGSGAGKYESTSLDNVAIGWNCFGGERSGGNSNQFNRNVAIGHQSLAQQRVANGDGENVCIGYRAMYNVTTGGWRNCIIGFKAGFTQNGASYNTFLGTFAGYNYTSGGNTMCLGYNAGTANSPSGALTTNQDTIVLGDNNISNFYCNDTSISSSDARDKTDVTEWTHGLSFINQLKPITYRWDKRTWYGTEEEPIGTPDGSKKRARLHLGFLAQDALAVEQSFGYASKKDDMLAVNLNEDGSAYGMKYERLVVPLTKAVQELSAEVDKLKAEITALKSS